MANKTKQELIVENNTSFPNNTTGAITAEDLRNFNADLIDSTVNQDVYTTDSSSFDSRIDSLEAFTASQQPSFDALNEFTQSQIAINNGLSSATSSLSSSIGVVSAEVDVLQSWSSSVNEIKDDGVLQGYSTRLHFGGLVSASVSSNVDGPIASITVLQDDTKLNSSSFNTYTQSNDSKWAYLGTQSGSWDAASDITPLNEFTASQLVLNSGYNSATASLSSSIGVVSSEVDILQSWSSSVNEIRDDGTLLGYSTRLHFSGNVSASIVQNVGGPIASINIPFSPVDTGSLLLTASFDNNTRDLTFTKGDSSTFAVNIPDVSGSDLPSGVVSGSSQIILQDTTGLLSGSRIDGAVALATNSTYADNTIVYGKNLEGAPIIKGSPLYFTGSGTSGNLVGIYYADAGNPSRMPAGGVAGETIAVGEEGIILLDGFISGVDTTAFASGDEVYVGVGGGYTNVVPTGSNNLIQSLGYVEKSAVNGSGVIQMSGEARSLPNLQSGYAWVGDGNDVPQAIATSSFAGDSFPYIGDAQITGSLSVSKTIESQIYINPQTLSGSLTIPTDKNAMLVGPVSIDGTLVVEGNSNLLVLSQVSGSGGGTTIETGSFATTGSNTFNGDQNIIGNVTSSTHVINSNDGLILRTNDGTSTGEVRITPGSNPPTKFTPSTLSGIDNIDALKLSGSWGQVGDGAPAIGISSGVGLYNHGTGSTEIVSLSTRTYSPFIANNSGAVQIKGDSIILNSSSSLGTTSVQVTGDVSASVFTGSFVGDGSGLTNVTASNGGVTSITAGTGISIDQGTGDVTISSTGGGSIDTGSFATTGSNSFVGNQIFPSQSEANVLQFDTRASSGNDAHFWFGIREDGNLVLSASVDGGMSSNGIWYVSPDNLWTEFGTQTQFNDSVGFRGQMQVRDIRTEPGFGYDAQFDAVGITGSLEVSGSVSLFNKMNLKPQDPLPSGNIGDLAVSGSSLYFYNGAWTVIV
jgi:hypothetical protein